MNSKYSNLFKKKLTLSHVFLFFLLFSIYLAKINAQNDYYIIYSTGHDAVLNPASLYKIDYYTCEIEHLVQLNIRPHVPLIRDWTDIAICPQGDFYFIAGDGRVFKIDTISGELEFFFKFENALNNFLLGLAIDYNGVFYSLGQYRGDIHIYYPETEEQYRSPPTSPNAVGLDITFYENKIFFHDVLVPWPQYFLITNLLGTKLTDSLFSHELPVYLGGMSTYADSCKSYYVIGSPNVIRTAIGYNHSVYKADIRNETFEPLCDRFILPNPTSGVIGAAHRYENLASMPAVELQSSEYQFEYIDDCSPSTARLTVTASGGISDIYFALNDNNFSRDSVFVLDEPGWYEIIAKDSRSCFWTDSFYFDPPPGLSFGEIIIGEEACPGAVNGTVEVSVFGGFSPYVYTINGGNPQSDGVFGELTAGDYFIDVIDSMGCRIDTLVQLGVSAEPDFELMVENEYCQSSNGRIEVTGSSLAGMEFSLNGSDFQDSPVFEDLPAGIYSVWVRDSLDCLYSETAEIFRIEEVIFTHLSDTSCSYAVLSLDSMWLTSAAGCDSVIITQRVPADFTTVVLQDFDCFAQQTYSDSIWIQHSDDCDTLIITTYSPAPSDSIFITRDTCSWQPIADDVFLYSNQYGCDSVVMVQYNQFLPSLTELDSLICHQSSPDTLFLTNHLGCDSLVIIRYHTVDLWLDLGPDLYIQAGEEVMLNPQYNMQIESFAWQPENFLSDPENLFPLASPEQDIQYRLMVTDIHGCTINDDINIFVSHPDLSFPVYIPNAFSPNDDGINDVFTVYFAEGQHPHYSLKVWDRWGALIYNCSGDNCQWDGTFKGQPMQAGTYLFELRFALNGSEEIRVGEVVLVR